MYGLPQNHPLSVAAEMLLAEHFRATDVAAGMEDPLLLQLQRAKASSTAGTPGGGTATGSPLNVGALVLWDEITATVDAHWPGRYQTSTAYREANLRQRLELWVTLVPEEDRHHLLEMCQYWVYRIRELLEPSKHVVLRGQSCPDCKCVRFPHSDEDGGTVLSPPLVAHLSESPLRIECRACEAQWSGEMEISLYFATPLPQA